MNKERFLLEFDYLSYLIENMKEPTIKSLLEVHYYISRHNISNNGGHMLNERFVKSDITNLPCGENILYVLENYTFDEIFKKHNDYRWINPYMQKIFKGYITDYEESKLSCKINESLSSDNISFLDIAKDGNANQKIITYITKWK